MATAERAEDSVLKESPVGEALRENPCSFEFFQAVTLLQKLRSERQPVGGFSHPEDEVVHFCANNGLAFPASEIQAIDWESAPARMTVNFMGLTGPMGVLPYCYSELILARQREKDRGLQAFLDIFNHRMISFFYRAWSKYRFPVSFHSGEDDLFTRHLLNLIGLGGPGLQDRQAVPDEALLHFAGLLGMQARSAAALEQILNDYFDVPAEVEEFTGAWYRLDSDTQCRMSEDESESQQLGLGAVVGDEIWDQQSRVRIKLGPMSLARYQDFLPEGSAFEPLRAITKFFCNDELDFEVQLILKREEAPRCEIGAEGSEGPRLGWITWLRSAPLACDPSETTLNL